MTAEPLERWHRWVRDDRPGGLDELLADDVTFHSPIVFAPQGGRALTAAYLEAAKELFGAGGAGDFHYVREVVAGRHAVLEFEATVDGAWVNGVDMITWDDDGRITDFKVMVRPLRAIETVHRRMGELLEALAALIPPTPED